MNELQIVINQKPGVISTNFEDIKAELSAQMQVYKELEVTEENKQERKKDIATLRKMQKAITDKKSEVRNTCLKPYEEFNEQANALAEIIQEPIRIIDNQVKEFEEKQRLAKIADIKKLFAELIGDLAENLSLDMIYDSKWENAATSKKAIKEDLTAKIDKVRQEVSVISSMVSDKTPEALNGYWEDLNMTRAIATINSFEEYKKRILAQQEERLRKEKEAELELERERIRTEERKKIQEEERIREEERRKAAEAEERIKEEESKRAAEKEEAIREEERQKALAEEERIREEERIATEQRLMGIKEPAEPIDLEAPFDIDEQPFIVPGDVNVNAVFNVAGTPFELQQVEMYLNSIGLQYERRDE